MKLLIKHGFDKGREKLLLSRGVTYPDLMQRNNSINLEESLVKISADIPNMVSRTISKQKQLKAIEVLMTRPLRGSYAVGISSFPSDLKAKQLAVAVMNVAMLQYAKSHRKAGRGMPLWHKVYGGLGDPLRDKSNVETPSLLIISNINSTSTGYKLEKVRDLLEKYAQIPRIVITGGEDPITLFATKLNLPLKAAVYLGPANHTMNV